MSIISRIILLIFALILPIIAVYTYANRETIKVMSTQIDSSNASKLNYVARELDQSVQDLSFYAYSLMNDSDVELFSSRYLAAFGYDRYEIRRAIQSKMALINNFNSPWDYYIVLHFPEARTTVSNKAEEDYDEQFLNEHSTRSWTTSKPGEAILPSGRTLTKLFTIPKYAHGKLLAARSIVQISIPEGNFASKLDTFKTSGINDPFFYRTPEEIIYNSTSDKTLAQRIIPQIGSWDAQQTHGVVTIDGQSYSVYLNPSAQLGWTLVDYIPLQQVFGPVYKSNTIFYSIVALLVLLGLSASAALYTQIQIPIKQLISSVRRFKKGDFSVRLTSKKNSEFTQVFNHFNEMAEEIQHLVEKVYLEEIRAKEAVMKQLQSQINPHFLYNCFAYMISMSKMNRNEAINSMAYRLSKYYRYATKNETIVATVREELEFVTQYLEIMNMQLGKISYAVEVDETILAMDLPRLLVQPLVENAIVHGLEEKAGAGCVRIIGRASPDGCQLAVVDDGIGMSDAQIAELNRMIDMPLEPHAHIGLWNVQQRLRYFFGPTAALQLSPEPGGGIRATLQWTPKEATPHV